MVKIRIKKVQWPDEELYVGGVYEAFKMVFADGHYDYAAHVDTDKIIGVKPENCEVINEEGTQDPTLGDTEDRTCDPRNRILLVEDGSVDTDDLTAWCDDHNIKMVVYRANANKPEFLVY